jgi:hypothetical protein
LSAVYCDSFVCYFRNVNCSIFHIFQYFILLVFLFSFFTYLTTKQAIYEVIFC